MSKRVPLTGIFLINLGTPQSPSVPDVRRYLREFLMDGRVIDIPWLKRFFLVNCVIAPFRAPQSAKIYQLLWTREGSPLKVSGYKVKELLQKKLGNNFHVALGMRYQFPTIQSALDELKKAHVDKLIVLPLYPQYASASTGSTIEKVMEELRKDEIIPDVQFISKFFEHELFIKSFAEKGKRYLPNNYDHFIFSYHGLPERQIRKASLDNYCQLDKCCGSYHAKNQYCYRAQCFETTRLLAKALNIAETNYTVSFQSRLGKEPWIKPYTDVVIEELARKGVKKILCFSPAFVADCLETTIEIGVEYKKLFLEHGGERLDLVESLNESASWIDCLADIITCGRKD